MKLVCRQVKFYENCPFDSLFGKWEQSRYWLYGVMFTHSASLFKWCSLRHLLTGFTKTAFPVLKIEDRLIQVFFSEIRPKGAGKVQFAISNLP